MTLAMMPELAEGIKTLLIVCQRVAPIAKLPSLYSRGTARIASVDMLMMVGSIMIERIIQQARTLVPNPPNSPRIHGTITRRAKNP
jgi:hypothetical protein